VFEVALSFDDLAPDKKVPVQTFGEGLFNKIRSHVHPDAIE
jgi:hypothetical protein